MRAQRCETPFSERRSPSEKGYHEKARRSGGMATLPPSLIAGVDGPEVEGEHTRMMLT